MCEDSQVSWWVGQRWGLCRLAGATCKPIDWHLLTIQAYIIFMYLVFEMNIFLSVQHLFIDYSSFLERLSLLIILNEVLTQFSSFSFSSSFILNYFGLELFKQMYVLLKLKHVFCVCFISYSNNCIWTIKGWINWGAIIQFSWYSIVCSKAECGQGV